MSFLEKFLQLKHRFFFEPVIAEEVASPILKELQRKNIQNHGSGDSGAFDLGGGPGCHGCGPRGQEHETKPDPASTPCGPVHQQ